MAWLNISGTVIAYVSTASGKIYAFNVDNRSWVSSSPVYVSGQPGTLRSLMKAPVPVTPTPSPTTTPSPSATLSAGASPSNSASPSYTGTSSRTPTTTGTGSPSQTSTGTPSPTPSPVNLFSGAGADLVVMRIASGVASNIATPALIDVLRRGADNDAQLTVAGTVPMPMSPSSDPSQLRLTVAGTDTRWGALSRSDDGRYIVVAGVDAAPGAAWSAEKRTVGTLSFTGEVNVSTSFLPSQMYANGIFAAGSVDGSGFWACGAGTATNLRGVAYIPAGNRSGTVVW